MGVYFSSFTTPLTEEEEELKSEVETAKTSDPAPSSVGDEEGSKSGVRIQEDENVSTSVSQIKERPSWTSLVSVS